jgi:hypothetical protein
MAAMIGMTYTVMVTPAFPGSTPVSRENTACGRAVFQVSAPTNSRRFLLKQQKTICAS